MVKLRYLIRYSLNRAAPRLQQSQMYALIRRIGVSMLKKAVLSFKTSCMSLVKREFI